MSSYHDSFDYRGKNSFTDMNLIISSFEPDDGFTETFLSMDPVYEENFDGSKIFNYGARYNTQAKINITLIKRDQSDFTIKEFRDCARWLTGARTDSWLEMFVGPDRDANGNKLKENIVYSFLGKITDLQQYKLDGRTVGLQIIFSSVAPWAFSNEETCDCYFGQAITIDNDGMIYVGSREQSILSVDENGILYAGASANVGFSLMDEQHYDGVICIDNTVPVQIDNLTDDLYTYINLDIKFTNENSKYLSIKHKYSTIDDIPIEEETKVLNMTKGEVVLLSSGQFIISEQLTADLSVNKDTVGSNYFVEDLTQLSGYRQVDLPKEYQEKDENGAQILYYHYTPNKDKIFGDDFNFVWPKLAPGLNNFAISGEGAGHLEFTYRYPMKIGNCTLDTSTYGSDIDCDAYPSGGGNGAFTGTVSWDKITGKPETIYGYHIDDEVYTKHEVDIMLDNITIDNMHIDKDELNELLANALG